MRLRLLACTLALAALVPFTPRAAHAQLRDVKELTLEGVKNIMAAAEAEARKQNLNVSIAVVDPSGNLLAFVKMDGAGLSSVDVSQGKARTAARFRRPTKALEETVAGGRAVLMTFPGIVPVEGGVPIMVDGRVVGAVGVSGATSAQDAAIADAGIAAMKR